MKVERTPRVDEYIKETDDKKLFNKPIDFSRIVVETDEDNAIPIAVITDDNFEFAEGLRVRAMPVIKSKKKK